MTTAGEALSGAWRRAREAWRGSLGMRLVAVMLAVLVAATLVTYGVETRLARVQLDAQARRTLAGHLDTVAADMLGDQTQLTTSLRNLAQSLSLDATDGLPNYTALLARLGEFRRSLHLDTLAVTDGRGRVVATVGTPLPDLPDSAADEATPGPIYLLRTMDGRYAKTALVPFTAGGQQAVLVGGSLFDDATAYELRRVTGNDVLLVADGRLVGSTLARPGAVPALLPGPEVPADPLVAEVDGRPTFVEYRTIASPRGVWAAGGAVGLAVPEPTAGLGRALDRTRIGALVGLVLLAGALAWLLARRLSRPLRRLTETASRIGAGDLDESFEVETEDEAGLLAATLEGMRQTVLEQIRIIREQSRELAAAGERVVSAQADERRHLAQDLHDGVQQRLVVLLMRLGALREAAAAGDASPEAVRDLQRDAERALEELRTFSQAIYPSILQDRGLTPALHSLASRSPVAVEVAFDPDPLPRLPPAVEANAYFVVSEAVTNALKHAAADRIRISLRVGGASLRLHVDDDGVGFDAEATPLPHLEDRARMLGGSCEVVSAPGQGTQVTATLPLMPRRPDQREAATDEVALELDDPLEALLERKEAG